jgi:hypothetical protein
LGIGSNYAGGIVFDLDSSGQHGLVCAPYDQGGSNWYGAVSICENLILNGYSDWYLPSRGELHLMYNRLRTQGLGGFANVLYWSSSQNNPDDAWYVNFNNGSAGFSYKHVSWQVRAVRAF